MFETMKILQSRKLRYGGDLQIEIHRAYNIDKYNMSIL